MAETNVTTNLRALLYALHGKRAAIARNASEFIQDVAAAGNKDDTSGSQFGSDLKVVQEEIEAVERAIADELKMAEDAHQKAHLAAMQKRAGNI